MKPIRPKNINRISRIILLIILALMLIGGLFLITQTGCSPGGQMLERFDGWAGRNLPKWQDQHTTPPDR